MRILMVNKFLYYRGGAETYFLKIGKMLEDAGHEVSYFGMEDERNAVGNRLGAATQNMDFHDKSWKRLFYPFRIIYSHEAKRKIKQVIADFKPDIVHLNNINFQLTPSVIDAAYEMKVPVVQTVHDYQMLCPNHLLHSADCGVCERCIHGSPWNCFWNKCIHGSAAKSLIGTIEALLYRKRGTYKRVDKFICPSAFIENKLQENPIFRGKTIRMQNFIETLTTLNDERWYSNENPYVLFFGRLSEEKGLHLFLDAARKLPHVSFKIAGTGPMEEQCKGIENVSFVGFKTGSELHDLIAGAMFTVYPSVWYENCPLSVLESQMLGTPVIASDMGGIPELIEDGKTGILLKKLTVDEMAAAIDKLFHDADRVINMSAYCLFARRKMTSLQEYCTGLIKVFDELLAFA